MGGCRAGRRSRHNWLGRVAALGLAVWIAGGDSGGTGAAIRGDFDRSGGLELVDFFLLVDALGRADPTYDLDGDRRVGREDVAAFVELFVGRDPAKAADGEISPGADEGLGAGETASSGLVDAAATDSMGRRPEGAANAAAVDRAAGDAAVIDSTAGDPAAVDTTGVDAVIVDTRALDPVAADLDRTLVGADSLAAEGAAARLAAASGAGTVEGGQVDTATAAARGAAEGVDSTAVGPTRADTLATAGTRADTGTAGASAVDSAVVDAGRGGAAAESTRVDTGADRAAAGVDSGAVDPLVPGPVGVDTTTSAGAGEEGAAAGGDTEAVEPGVAAPAAVDTVHYTLVVQPDRTEVTFPEYTVAVQHGQPFGIVALRLRGQPVDFVHPELPLADWEWLWLAARYEDEEREKLLQPTWGAPVVDPQADGVVLRFRRADVLRPGLELEVVYRFQGEETGFAVDYWLHNRTRATLKRPYVMLGFPGFANYGWVVEVGDPLHKRVPLASFRNFRAEARAQEKEEYLLLRHDVDPREEGQELRGEVVLGFGTQRYRLSTGFVPSAALREVYSAHTNKPAYLSSHLYLYMGDVGPGQSRQFTVQYTLSRE